MPVRRRPNFMVIGTPGTGKTTIVGKVVALTGLNVMNLGEIVKEHNLTLGHDSQRNCSIIDEARLIDYIEEDVLLGGNIIEYHGCDMFTPATVDKIFVLRCKSDVLYDRLNSRGYCTTKIQENVQCEIFGELEREARDNFPAESVFSFNNDEWKNVDDIANAIYQQYHAFV